VRSRRAATLALVLAAVGLAAAGAPAVRADTPQCAQTTDPTTPGTPTPGNPCWTDVEPYPFGYDGNPVDPNSPYCVNQLPGACYLLVDSLAFRAWNDGLAAVSPTSESVSSTAAYGVWRYNGTRWYPDPTFPGQTACPGSTILWAGKLDAWLVGAGGLPGQSDAAKQAWPALCRFDGVNDQWEPLPVPKVTIAEAGRTGAITSGACFAYNNCWFFGTGGAVVHWDGQTLSNASVGLGASPWLTSDYTAATAGSDAQGSPFALALAAVDPSSQAQPDGASAPQLFASTGEQFSPLPFSPQASGESGGSPGTDLDAVAFDAQGDGWIAGNPAAPAGSPSSTSPFTPFGNDQTQWGGPAPLLPISSTGTAESCPGTPPGSFMYSGTGASTSYLWSSIAVMGGDALAGGMVGLDRRGNPETEPVLAQVSCVGAPQVTRFRIPDPTGGSALIPADGGGYVTAVAASAVNNAWAATKEGATGAGALQSGVNEPPHLYLLTDGQPPDAPAGDNDEVRPVVVTAEPTIFSFAPPVVIPSPPPPTTVVKRRKAKVEKITLEPAVYDIARPTVMRASLGSYTLSITFKVRRKVTIGLEATRHGKVVSRSGLRTFSGHRGTLTVRLSPSAWPTGLKFILPKSTSKSK